MTFETFQLQAAARHLANGRFEAGAGGMDAALKLAPSLPTRADAVHGLRLQQAFAIQYAQDHLFASHAGVPRQGR